MGEKSKYTNALVHESSPYLLQHAHNPVDWMPWGTKALQKAKKENKLILVSIGYSSCHWCHVMEHESFEDEEVAHKMNTSFVCIKIDREERPDLDQIYLLAVQLMTQRGGWPLNCFCLPDGRPIYGGTYFPKDQWLYLMDLLQKGYQTEPKKYQEYAEQLHLGIQQAETIIKMPQLKHFDCFLLEELIDKWTSQLDMKLGGHLRAPKFPMPNNLQFLLQYGVQESRPKIVRYVKTTLLQMARGGIYDQIGGGFARYSTDIYWKVPHFEKMLYDNAQLISLYAQAYAYFQEDEFKVVVDETMAWLKREMKGLQGGFYAALDADSEGKEGKFYTWEKNELTDLLGEDANWFEKLFELNESGYWHENDAYILLRNTNLQQLANQTQTSIEECVKKWNTVKNKLLIEREKRVRPGLDHKILCSWNALLIAGLCNAYTALEDMQFKNEAIHLASWMKQIFFQKEGALKHCFTNEKATINGFLEDYASVIAAWIELYQITFDENWLFDAEKLIQYCETHFGSPDSPLFYISEENPELIARKMEINDNVVPSSNSIMANNYFKLGKLLQNDTYLEKSAKMLSQVVNEMPHYGSGYSNWAILYHHFSSLYHEVVIVGDDAKILASKLQKNYLPQCIFVASEKENTLSITHNKKINNKTKIYVCANKQCQLPQENLLDVLKMLQVRN